MAIEGMLQARQRGGSELGISRGGKEISQKNAYSSGSAIQIGTECFIGYATVRLSNGRLCPEPIACARVPESVTEDSLADLHGGVPEIAQGCFHQHWGLHNGPRRLRVRNLELIRINGPRIEVRLLKFNSTLRKVSKYGTGPFFGPATPCFVGVNQSVCQNPATRHSKTLVALPGIFCQP
jgi:hypothetical protein